MTLPEGRVFSGFWRDGKFIGKEPLEQKPSKITSATLYIGEEGGRWEAAALHGDPTEEQIASAARGNGVIVHWPRGRGEVFTAGTCEWVMGLKRGDRQVERVTRNVLDRFSAPRSA